MSKDIDPYRMTADDVAYVQHRPMLRQEFRLQGLGDPLSEDYPYLVDDEGNFINEQDGSESPSPDSDTSDTHDEDGFPLNTDKEKPQNWKVLSDEEKRLYVYGESKIEEEGKQNVQATLPEDQQWSDQMKKKELKAVIAARNEGREDDWKISFDNDNNDTLMDALRADDQRIAEFRASNPDE